MISTTGIVLLMVTSFIGFSTLSNSSHPNKNSLTMGPGFGGSNLSQNATNPFSLLSPLVITHPPGGGGGGSGGGNSYPPVYYTIEIYGGNAEAEVSGDVLSNGQTIMLIASSSYTIQAVSIASPYSFFQWETNSGSINNYESPTTTLNTGYSNGILTLVLNAASNNWAGFVQSGSVQSATGEFYVPSASYVGGTPNLFGLWVGIGGNGGTNLWQAGIAVEVSDLNVESIIPFYEDWPQQSSGIYNQSFSISAGDLVQVWVNYSNGFSTFSIVDYTNHHAWKNGIPYTPNTQTAEWILENQCEAGYSLPDFGTVTWMDVSSNIGNLLYPVAAFHFSVANNAQYGYVYGGAGLPGYLTSPSDFYVTYYPP